MTIHSYTTTKRDDINYFYCDFYCDIRYSFYYYFICVGKSTTFISTYQSMIYRDKCVDVNTNGTHQNEQ